MDVVELFAGGGLAAIGLHRAGFHHAALVEYDDAANATLRVAFGDALFARPHAAIGRSHPGVVRAHDLREPLRLPSAPLWWASPPCQPFSHSGDRLGPGDPRNGWPWLVRDLRSHLERGAGPVWLLAENVRGFRSHRSAGCDETCSGCYAETVLREVRALFAWADFGMFDAADFGVPQRRHRVILAAGPDPFLWPARTASGVALAHAKWTTGDYWREHGIRPVGEPSREERRALRLDPPADRVRWRTMRDALDLGADSRDAGVGTNPRAPGRSWERTERECTDEPGPTVTAARIGNAGPWIETGQRTERAAGIDVHRVGPDQPAPAMIAGGGGRRPYTLCTPASARVPDPDAPAPVVDGTHGGRLHPESEMPPWWYRASPADEPMRSIGSKGNAAILLEPTRLVEPSPAVTATEVKGAAMSADSVRTSRGGLQRASDALQLATGRRRLTVAECSILQSAPADWPYQGDADDQYRMVGNGVPCLLAEALGRAAFRALRP